jgi:hypothetical protein
VTDLDVVRVRVLPDGRLDRKNAALYLGRSPKTLAQSVQQGKGPLSHDIGGRAFYYLEDCEAFIRGPSATCAVKRRRFSSGCKAHPATAPAGSNRSRHGGDEMSEAFG